MGFDNARVVLGQRLNLSTIIAIFTILGTIWGVVSYVDGRYVKTSQYERDMAILRSSEEAFRADIQHVLHKETLTLRKTIISDALFELDFKRRSAAKEWTALDEAKYQRYLREYGEVDGKLTSLRR